MIALLLPLGLAYARRSPTILQKLAVHIFIPYSTGGYVHKARGTENSPGARYLSRRYGCDAILSTPCFTLPSRFRTPSLIPSVCKLTPSPLVL